MPNIFSSPIPIFNSVHIWALPQSIILTGLADDVLKIIQLEKMICLHRINTDEYGIKEELFEIELDEFLQRIKTMHSKKFKKFTTDDILNHLVKVE